MEIIIFVMLKCHFRSVPPTSKSWKQNIYFLLISHELSYAFMVDLILFIFVLLASIFKPLVTTWSRITVGLSTYL